MQSLKAEETRKRLYDELNSEFVGDGFFGNQEETVGTNTFSLGSIKPRMFEPKVSNNVQPTSNSIDMQSIKGIGFNAKVNEKSQEIYSMKELIKSNPENMQTFSYDPKIIKAQYALVKKRNWEEILFSDVDWFKPIDLSSGFKALFKL